MSDVEVAEPGPRRGDVFDDPRIRRPLEAVGVTLLLYWLLQQFWPTPAGVVVQGVIIGALTALISFGIALIYRSNRVINFAQADLGAVPAVLAVSLMNRTTTELSIDGVKEVNQGISYWVAIPMAILLAVVLGALIERVLIRRFSRAPRLILMVVTIGLSQILAGVGTVIPLALFDTFQPNQRYDSPFDFTFEVAPIIFRGNDLIAVVISLAAIGGLIGFLRYTNIGIAIRASAESSDRASLLGINVGRTQNVAWIIATVLATVAMLLRAGILGLPLGSAFGPTILLRALGAAVIGRMENFALMFAAACGLGIVETAVIWNTGSATLVDPALFVIVIGALLLQRSRRESRAEDQATSSWQIADMVRPIPRELAALREVRWARRLLACVLGLAVILLPVLLNDGDTNLAAAVFIYAIIAVSLVMLTGWAGEISLGQVAFVAIGAAVAGGLNVHQGWDLTLTTLAAGAIGAVASVIIGLPALRIRGLFLAVSTMAFALATSSYLLNPEYFGYLPDNLTERVQRYDLFGRADISSETAFYFVCLGALLIVLWAVRGLQRSRSGRILIATRDNPRAAQAFGINLTRAKLLAFAMSGFFASFAGGLFAVHQRAVGQDVFAPAESIRALTMVVVGGLGSVPGALLGAVFLKSTEWFNTIVPQEYRFLFTFAGSGIGLIFVLLFLPGGLGSLMYRIRDSFLRRVARRHGLVVPSLVADTSAEPDVLKRARGDDADDETARPGIRRRRELLPVGGPQFLHRLARRRAPELDYLSFPDVHAESEAPQHLLSIRGVDVAYGQVQVLFGVSLDVRAGEIIALLGTNGAGKSTVLRAACGLTPPRGGTITFDGHDITGAPPHRVAALGMIQVPGGRGIFPSLTVAENLRAASWMYRKDGEYIEQATEEVLELFPILRRKLDQQAAALSGGQQQMLTLGMAFIAKPKLLMIDELSLGLAPVVVEQLLEVVKELRRRGTTLILVEQSVNVALTVAETAYFMEKGEVKFHGPTAELLTRPDVLRSVFLEGAASQNGSGPSAPAPARRRRLTAAEHQRVVPVVLQTHEVTKSFAGVRAIDDVSIQLHEGEILGVIGPNGAGKTTLFDLLSGFLQPDHGRIELLGRDITRTRPDTRSLLGLARSFQDARLFGSLTVHQAIAVALDRELGVRDPVAAALNLPVVHDAEERVGDRADELIELMGIEAFRDKFVAELSTGSRRIVDIGCQIGLEPKVILFDEPSSGIAQREAEALGPLLQRIRQRTGASLLVIEHDMPLVTGIADRIVALDLGRVIIEGDATTVLNDPTVVASYLGSSREVIERSGSVTEAVAEVVGVPG